MTFLGQKSVKNGQLYHFLDVPKLLASKKFYKKCSENSRSQITLTCKFNTLDGLAIVCRNQLLKHYDCPGGGGDPGYAPRKDFTIGPSQIGV